VLRQVAQQGQTGQQAFSEQLQAGGSGAGGAATGGLGGAAVASAANDPHWTWVIELIEGVTDKCLEYPQRG